MSLDPLLAAPWHIQLHAFAAMAALGLGVVQIAAPKGTIPHRTLGYVWVALMLIVAITAIFIRNGGQFSWIHLFVPLTLYGTWELVMHARRGNAARHRGAVMGMVLFALMVPGLFSFMPGRIMHQVAFGG
ncbi:MAG: DUF2306 domain-containing protein [Maricaulaceae bacterium]|nr:DUF2306 domain-containing protein [Maricaulaceae bacterium]